MMKKFEKGTVFHMMSALDKEYMHSIRQLIHHEFLGLSEEKDKEKLKKRIAYYNTLVKELDEESWLCWQIDFDKIYNTEKRLISHLYENR